MNNVTLTSKCKALHFDISQTDGEPVPRLGVEELTGIRRKENALCCTRYFCE